VTAAGGCGLTLDLDPATVSESADAGTGSADASRTDTDSGPADAARRTDAAITDAAIGADARSEIPPRIDPDEPLRVEMPCGSRTGATWCDSPGVVDDTAVLVGESGRVYEVVVRVRGVFEDTSYEGGTRDGYFHADGTTLDGDPFNVVGLDVDAAAQRYFLNSGLSDRNETAPIDYTATILAVAGSTLRLYMDDRNLVSARNYDGHTVPDIPPFPEVVDGQFVQLDVVGLRALP
jgi:hypothetical protein